jgi:acetoin utilization protein AcuC
MVLGSSIRCIVAHLQMESSHSAFWKKITLLVVVQGVHPSEESGTLWSVGRACGAQSDLGGHVQQGALIWRPDLADYDLGDHHPLNPLRLTLSVELMEAYHLLSAETVVEPRLATERELFLVHAPGYVEAVREASDWAATGLQQGMGLGTEDNPIYPGMHDVAALTCGASIVAVEEVLSGRRKRTFSIAGGMHHAHRGRAAGFSIFNDPAVAIAAARAQRPDLKVLYIDIDAHHGDGVQEAFLGLADVMTVSIHESGIHAFPGTGFPSEMGYDAGCGYAVNVPMPIDATDECFQLAFDRVLAPLARAFGPDVIVAQLGADAHHDDPQTDLGLTLPGYRALVTGIIGLADELCDGRLAALGGGGYHIVEVVPLAWTWVMATLLGVELADEVPESWRDHVRALLGGEPPRSLGAHDRYELAPAQAARALELTQIAVAEVRSAVFPRHGLQA